MRAVVLLAVASLSLAEEALPTLPPTPAPATQAPPTNVPISACLESSSPLSTSFAVQRYTTYLKCWTFQCTGDVHITFLNVTLPGKLSLVNSNGYELTSLTGTHDNYTGSYPANGDMLIVFEVTSDRNPLAVNFTVEWECEEGTPVPPAVGYNSAEYLTLPPVGTYERLFSALTTHKWTIPCTGTIDIEVRLGTLALFSRVGLNSSNTTVFSLSSDFGEPVRGNYSVDGYFFVELQNNVNNTFDDFFFFSWSCNGVSPPLPTLPPTPAPATQAPPTNVPISACLESSSPLFTSFAVQRYTTYLKCWTFQCTGDVHITFLNVTLPGKLSLVNSNGYELTSLTGTHDNYTGSYPANGDMLIVYEVTSDRNPLAVNFTVEWECEEGTPVPPAVGYNSAEYLTLPPVGTYERLFSALTTHKWTIPCTGTIDIEVHLGNVLPSFASYGGISVYPSAVTGGTVLVDGYFIVEVQAENYSTPYVEIPAEQIFKNNTLDNFFFFSWSCNGVSPPLPTLPPTPAPATQAPPTNVPISACLESSSPLSTSFAVQRYTTYLKCWTFQCTGDVHITFLNVTLPGKLSLVNSNGYELTSLTGTHDNYTGSYPANGDMLIVFEVTSDRNPLAVNFTVEWECEEGTPVPPAVGYNSAEYLTLPPVGTYERLFSMAPHKWMIPCTGTIDIEVRLGSVFSFSWFVLLNSNTTVFTQYGGMARGNYSVDGYFFVELHNVHNWILDNFFFFSWSCNETNNSHEQTGLPADTTVAPLTPAPATALPTATATGLPADTTVTPPTLAPATALPATVTGLPADTTVAPLTPAPAAALPTATVTGLPADTTVAPPTPPSVIPLCTTDKDCRSGRLDPKATCNAGMCVCHSQGYTHPPGVPLCLLADDVTVPMAFAVEYEAETRGLWGAATAEREHFEDVMHEALGTVTDMNVVTSEDGVLVVGMVRANTAKLADVISGKVNLTHALGSEGVSVSHGVTCASTAASYTVEHNGACNAVACDNSTTLTLQNGEYICESKTVPQPDDGSSGSNVALYVGIGVGVLGIVAGVAVACYFRTKHSHTQTVDSSLTKSALVNDFNEAELSHHVETLE